MIVNSNANRREFKRALQAVLIYGLDLLLPLSVVSLIVEIGMQMTTGTKGIYLEWFLNCYYFFLAFVIIQTYLKTFLIEENDEFG